MILYLRLRLDVNKLIKNYASESVTIQADKRNREFSRQIIGTDGHLYEVDMSRLENGELTRSDAKKKAARENGRKGGCPRKV